MQYKLSANLRVISADRVALTIEADSYEEAKLKAEEMLHSFPENSHSVDGVTYAFIEDRQRLETVITDINATA